MSGHIDINNDSKNDMMTLSDLRIPQECKQEENEELKNILGSKPIDIRRSQKFAQPKSSTYKTEPYEQSDSSARVIINSQTHENFKVKLTLLNSMYGEFQKV